MDAGDGRLRIDTLHHDTRGLIWGYGLRDNAQGTNKEQRARLAALRRLLVRFRRHLALEHLDGVASDLDLIHERVRLLQEEVANLLAEATNRNLYVLSIVTTALLPATLLTGFWGMNVGGLPWADDANGLLWTGLSVLASIAFSLALLRGSRVL